MRNANQQSATFNTNANSAIDASSTSVGGSTLNGGFSTDTAAPLSARRFVVCRPVDGTDELVTAAQLAAGRRLLVARAVAWLDISDRAEAQWMGSKTDLIEIARYVYEAQVVRTPDGRPMPFSRLAALFFAKLHTYFAHESFRHLYRQAVRRKGLCMPTMLWRFTWRMSVDRTADPLAGLIRLLRVPSDSAAPMAPAAPIASAVPMAPASHGGPAASARVVPAAMVAAASAVN